jgi:hypothetical protein
MKTDLTFLSPLVRKILVWPERSQWTVQGFGFLRTYFGPALAPKRFRLNLWDSRFTVPNVSTIHDHPWDLTSLIIAGEMVNQRYLPRDIRSGPRPTFGPTHEFTTIKTGEGGGLEKSPGQYCKLDKYPMETYRPGDSYAQHAEEVHETIFKDGTVTLNERVGDTEHARVFWPFGTAWVDAMPRPATEDEVSDAVGRSLAEWF